MSLTRLRKQLEGVNDWLVDTENEFTDAGDMYEFTQLHTLLDDMLEIVHDLQWEIDEGISKNYIGSQT